MWPQKTNGGQGSSNGRRVELINWFKQRFASQRSTMKFLQRQNATVSFCEFTWGWTCSPKLEENKMWIWILSFVDPLKQVDFSAFSHGAPSSSHSQVCVCIFGNTGQDSVWQSKTMSWCSPMGPTLHRWCMSRAGLGLYNVTGVRLFTTASPRDPAVGSSPYVRCLCVLLQDTHHWLVPEGHRVHMSGVPLFSCLHLPLFASQGTHMCSR